MQFFRKLYFQKLPSKFSTTKKPIFFQFDFFLFMESVSLVILFIVLATFLTKKKHTHAKKIPLLRVQKF